MEPNGWVCPYLTQSWVKTTQQFLECNNKNNSLLEASGFTCNQNFPIQILGRPDDSDRNKSGIKEREGWQKRGCAVRGIRIKAKPLLFEGGAEQPNTHTHYSSTNPLTYTPVLPVQSSQSWKSL